MRIPALSDELFHQMTEYLFKETGITINKNKKYLVEYRLQKFIGPDKEFVSYYALFKALKEDRSGELKTLFINSLTTNYTFFFREPVHFRFLAYYLHTHGKNQTYIRLWSAGCSSGEEAYSMAITCLEQGFSGSHKDIRILASDISKQVLTKAQSGVYHYSAIRGELEDAYLRRYFLFNPQHKTFTVQDQVRSLVTFREFNLMDPFPFEKQFDLIFLRNVLIYFSVPEKEHILAKIWEVLKSPGYLVLGLSESLVGVRHRFTTLNNSIYRKEGM
uniref:protein-glutamate O-methyltransferase n=1 Tax=Gracilinema caldarium TaxID=215591 RepID=A0A7C3IFC3_9SPIR